MTIFNTKIHLRTQVLQQLITTENSCVEVVQQERDLRTMPYHGNNFSNATKEQLDALIGKYVKDLGGIVLGYKNIKILSEYALIDDDGLNNFPIRADFFVFKPIPGIELPATVTKRSKDHVGCLIYNTFNISIPKPESVTKWTGNNVEIGQEVIARVTFVKLESRIPYIRGEFLEKSKVNRKIKFTDDDTIQEDGENILDEEDSINIEDHTEISRKKKKKSSRNKEMIYEEPIDTNEKCPDEVDVKQMEDDLIRKKKKKSRRSKENAVDESNECIEMKEEFSEEVNNTQEKDDSIRKEKKKSRRSKENTVDESSNGCIEMREEYPDEDKHLEDDSIRKKKKKSHRSQENGDNEPSNECIEMKEECPEKVNNTQVEDDSIRKEKKKSRRSKENAVEESSNGLLESENDKVISDELSETIEEDIKPICDAKDDSFRKKKSRSYETEEEPGSEQKSKKRKHSISIEDEGRTKKRKMA